MRTVYHNQGLLSRTLPTRPAPPRFRVRIALIENSIKQLEFCNSKILLSFCIIICYALCRKREIYVERDVRQLVNIRNIANFEKFVRLLAGRVGQVVNLESLGNDAGVSGPTIREWLSVLEASYVIHTLKPYHENFGKRLVKSPKIYFQNMRFGRGAPHFGLGETFGRDGGNVDEDNLRSRRLGYSEVRQESKTRPRAPKTKWHNSLQQGWHISPKCLPCEKKLAPPRTSRKAHMQLL